MVADAEPGATRNFEALIERVEPLLRRALSAKYGSERGSEAVAEACAWAWEHRGRLDGIANPAAYLYRVGVSRTRKRKVGFLPAPPSWSAERYVEPGLPDALRALSPRQRVTVVLIYGFECSFAEVADLLGISKSAVQRHAERGMSSLRGALHVVD